MSMYYFGKNRKREKKQRMVNADKLKAGNTLRTSFCLDFPSTLRPPLSCAFNATNSQEPGVQASPALPSLLLPLGVFTLVPAAVFPLQDFCPVEKGSDAEWFPARRPASLLMLMLLFLWGSEDVLFPGKGARQLGSGVWSTD